MIPYGVPVAVRRLRELLYPVTKLYLANTVERLCAVVGLSPWVHGSLVNRDLAVELLCSTVVLLEQVSASSEFQLRLRSYRNDDGRAADGYCCTGSPNGLDAGGRRCTGTCRTFFRICLSHYTADISPDQPCTFGLLVTDVLGNDSIDFQRLTAAATDAADAAAAVADSNSTAATSPVASNDLDNGSTITNPVRMPISVTWPVRRVSSVVLRRRNFHPSHSRTQREKRISS